MRPLAAAVSALLLGLAFQGCGGDDNASNFNRRGGIDGGTDSSMGSCDVRYCRAMGSGTPCCLGSQCGTDLGNGCIPNTRDGG